MTDRTPTRGLRDRLAKAIRQGAPYSDLRPSYRVADAVLPVVEEETAVLRARAERAEAALRDLTDPRPCDPHPGNGYCQTHGETPPCPHAAAKEILDRTEETP